MEITCRIDKEILYIAIEGRIDASNATEAEEKIFNIKPDKSLILELDNDDADDEEENTQKHE